MRYSSKYSLDFKLKVSLEILSGDFSFQKSINRCSLSPYKLHEWLGELETHEHQAFEESLTKKPEFKKIQPQNKHLFPKVDLLSIIARKFQIGNNQTQLGNQHQNFELTLNPKSDKTEILKVNILSD